ncbi:hypothetical protein O2W14_16470 [Modestobacter sp. VKM Ac-2986]|uniref:hypothetical protein n=1 Tax=Modestobacter sp. VKM Ac-2986 TaxID=3004140 RepID=UPI0022ABA9C9|nr:hypothetical protein [Modestobacter sp. VKM Ac-2986]MCZ2830433.1 hypothetical protein [Modestobacter sp. VKM Ac-2986]
MNPSSGFVVRVENLPDRTYRLWLQTSGAPLDLGTVGRTGELGPAVRTRVAAHAGVPADELGAVEVLQSRPPWVPMGHPVLVHDEDEGWVPGYAWDFIQGEFLVDTPNGAGLYVHEDMDLDPPPEAMTYRGRHRE